MPYLVRDESITPLARYLSRARAADSAEAWLEAALVLLLREREYQALHLRMGATPPRIEAERSGLWDPYPLTAEGRRSLESDLALEGLLLPRDLFGVKAEVVEGLARALGPAESAADLPVLFRLWSDLLRYDLIRPRAERWAAAAPGDVVALGFLHQSLIMGDPDDQALLDRAAAVERQARPLIKGPMGLGWSWKVVERADEALHDRAIAVRRRHEPGFERYCLSERQFVEGELAAAMAAFDDAAVPEDLRSLVPAARRFGLGDDPSRAYLIRRATRKEREAVGREVTARGPAIDAWLATFDQTTELPPTPRAFFWLREAAEEILAAAGAKNG